MRINSIQYAAADSAGHAAASKSDPVREFAETLSRPVRYLGVGGLGLITDLAVFTSVTSHGFHPLLARLVSLALATLVTWRLNRALTFDRSGLRQADEAMRYVVVAAVAQSVSYLAFAVLVLTAFAAVPRFAVLAGAGLGAFVSYNGQVLFTFRRRRTAVVPQARV